LDKKRFEDQWETIWKRLQMHQRLLGGAALASLIIFLGAVVIVPLIVIALPRPPLQWPPDDS
jgi:hypothetical protein